MQSKNHQNIHKEVVEVYGENVISRKLVSVWCNQFKEGRTSLLDEERAGRPKTARNADNERRIEQLLVTDRCMKLKEIAYSLNLSKTTVYRIVHDTLGYRKVSTRWVPKELTEHHKAQRMGVSLTCCITKKIVLFLTVLSRDETWVHHITPETKWNSMIQKLDNYANCYIQTLKKLQQAIRRKRVGMHTRGVKLLHDNATPHTAGKM
jgi:transposase